MYVMSVRFDFVAEGGSMEHPTGPNYSWLLVLRMSATISLMRRKKKKTHN